MRELVYITDPKSLSFGYIVTKPENDSVDYILATYENYQALQKVFPNRTFTKIERAIERLEYFKDRLEKSTKPKFQSIQVVEETSDTGYVEAKFNNLKVIIRVNNPLVFWEILDGVKEVHKGELFDIKDFIKEHLKGLDKKYLKETFRKFRDFFEESDYFVMKVLPSAAGCYFLRVVDKETDKTAWEILLKYDEGLCIIIDGQDVSNYSIDEIFNKFQNPYHLARILLPKNVKRNPKRHDIQYIFDDLGSRIGYMQNCSLYTFVAIEEGSAVNESFTDFETLKEFLKLRTFVSMTAIDKLIESYKEVVTLMFPYNVVLDDRIDDGATRSLRFDLYNYPMPPTSFIITLDKEERKITFEVDNKKYHNLEDAIRAIRKFSKVV